MNQLATKDVKNEPNKAAADKFASVRKSLENYLSNLKEPELTIIKVGKDNNQWKVVQGEEKDGTVLFIKICPPKAEGGKTLGFEVSSTEINKDHKGISLRELNGKQELRNESGKLLKTINDSSVRKIIDEACKIAEIKKTKMAVLPEVKLYPEGSVLIDQKIVTTLNNELRKIPGLTIVQAIQYVCERTAELDPNFNKFLSDYIGKKISDPNTLFKEMARLGFVFDKEAFSSSDPYSTDPRKRILSPGKIPLIPIKAINLTPEKKDLLFLFKGKEIDESILKIHYSSNPYDNQGFSGHGLSMVDLDKTRKAHEEIQIIMYNAKKLNANINFGVIPFDKFRQAIEVNELAHLVLKEGYKFDSNDTFINWSKVSSGVKNYQIMNSLQVHEFISDAASALTPEGGIPLLIAKSIHSNAEGYEYSDRFLDFHFEKIAQRNGKSWDQIEKGFDKNDHAGKLQFVLGNTTPEDVKEIQRRYTAQTKVLLDFITAEGTK